MLQTSDTIDNRSFLCYIFYMTVTVEVKNQRTFDLLRAIEGLGLIHVNSAEKTNQEGNLRPLGSVEDQGEKLSYHWLRGCHKNIPGASVEDFLARSRADKEHELEIERRQEEERARRAGIHT